MRKIYEQASTENKITTTDETFMKRNTNLTNILYSICIAPKIDTSRNTEISMSDFYY